MSKTIVENDEESKESSEKNLLCNTIISLRFQSQQQHINSIQADLAKKKNQVEKLKAKNTELMNLNLEKKQAVDKTLRIF